MIATFTKALMIHEMNIFNNLSEEVSREHTILNFEEFTV